MYTPEQLRNIFSHEVVEYLVNKNRGGNSGAKGNTYENFFAIYQLALLAQLVIESNKKSNFQAKSLPSLMISSLIAKMKLLSSIINLKIAKMKNGEKDLKVYLMISKSNTTSTSLYQESHGLA